MDNDTRFWRNVSKTDGCWEWTAGKSDGYGLFSPTRRTRVRAHRYAYELLVGPIPNEMILDHICRNRSCVKPEHLRPVDKVQNAENHGGATRRSKSGVRGVCWSNWDQAWIGSVSHRGEKLLWKRFSTMQEAEAAVIEVRLTALTHNEVDRRITTMRPAR